MMHPESLSMATDRIMAKSASTIHQIGFNSASQSGWSNLNLNSNIERQLLKQRHTFVRKMRLMRQLMRLLQSYHEIASLRAVENRLRPKSSTTDLMDTTTAAVATSISTEQSSRDRKRLSKISRFWWNISLSVCRYEAAPGVNAAVTLSKKRENPSTLRPLSMTKAAEASSMQSFVP